MARRAVVLYDEDCGFCKWAVNRLLAWDRRDLLRPVSIQGEEGAELLGDMAESRRLDSWHLAMPSGEVYSGGAAVGPVANLLPLGKPLVVMAERFPSTTERCYRFVAQHRDLLAVLVGADASCEVRR